MVSFRHGRAQHGRRYCGYANAGKEPVTGGGSLARDNAPGCKDTETGDVSVPWLHAPSKPGRQSRGIEMRGMEPKELVTETEASGSRLYALENLSKDSQEEKPMEELQLSLKQRLVKEAHESHH
ncbi:hypothetical protein Nepgr_002514 [Nepenthes gracilis]|uniref:Uncharacterized protein n=1 Tax=Nepenthes gracilis TaxID=150966 RepID=A0AAD3P3X6_NEPGR|nr:hypothetical protein Nepgr_002514 [Nepenthes gracilis]